MEQTLPARTTSPAEWFSRVTRQVRTDSPTLAEWVAALSTAGLMILSFPNFGLSVLAWVALVPLLAIIPLRPSLLRAFILGWITGSLFFYGTCHWLTYSMIHYGGIHPLAAYLLLIPGALVVGLFPALFTLLCCAVSRRWGRLALLLTPFFWPACEWFRLGVTGQLWNALGYSQAYHPLLIQAASWGGVYAVGFSIAAVNVAITLFLLRRDWKSLGISISIAVVIALLVALSMVGNVDVPDSGADLNVVAVQPNVPMAPVKTAAETQELIDRHLLLSTNGLEQFGKSDVPRLVIWPESPMNFTYGSDRNLQDLISRFARDNHTWVLLNSLEAAPNDGGYNSALLINEEGRLIAQYDKIRLMPFGEYVPLPSWLGGSLISAIVGDFTPGDRYTLMPVANHQAGVFICIESAYPYIPRNLTNAGADVLINISNDGYLGPTAVMRQHLANAIFRAVENARPVWRVTNSGITAYISSNGTVRDVTQGFSADVRTWSISQGNNRNTFYTYYGDLFVQFCAVLTVLVFVCAMYRRRSSRDLK